MANQYHAERYLDYNRWWVCFGCNREVVPYEDEEIPETRLCSWCEEENWILEEEEGLL